MWVCECLGEEGKLESKYCKCYFIYDFKILRYEIDSCDNFLIDLI